MSPSGRLFDFFSANAAGADEDVDIGSWLKGEVIVLNRQPEFSPALSEKLLAKLRREFLYGENIGRFEVRWR